MDLRFWRTKEPEVKANPLSPQLQAILEQGPLSFTPDGSVSFFDAFGGSYGKLYRSNSALRAVVDFLSRNIAQCAMKLGHRDSEGVSRPEPDHPVQQLLDHPQSGVARARFYRQFVADKAIYDVAAIWKIRENFDPTPDPSTHRVRNTGTVRDLVRIPVPFISIFQGSLASPAEFRLTAGRDIFVLPAADVIWMPGYSPTSNTMGTPPVETLKQMLAEEWAAGKDRENYWKRGPQMHTVFLQDGSSADLTDEQAQRFHDEWQNRYGGVNASNAGAVPLIPSGLTPHEIAINAQTSEYVSTRTLAREEVCRAYGIQPQLLGITPSNFASMDMYHCVTPETPVLMADLTYIPAGKLNDSDEVFGFEENIGGKDRSRLRTAVVTNTTRGTQPLVRVTTTHGTVDVSAGHPFLVTIVRPRLPGDMNRYAWVEAENLDLQRHVIVSLGPTWERDDAYEAGWLAGMFDGEGSAHGHGAAVVSQNLGPTLDRIEASLVDRGIEFHTTTPAARECRHVVVRGGLADLLRFYGTVRPERLIAKRQWEGATTRGLKKATVLSVEHLGDGEVVELSTTTHTFVAAGLLSHNTMLYQDTLAPWMVPIQEEFEEQLLREFETEDSGYYLDFNINAKLQGSFLDQAKIGQQAVGGPWMTRNEFREKFQGLPPIDGGDDIVVPLNVALGGGPQANPQDAQNQFTEGKSLHLGEPETKVQPVVVNISVPESRQDIFVNNQIPEQPPLPLTVNVEPPNVNVEASNITVESPSVLVTVPEQAPPTINVEVPETKVDVHVPESRIDVHVPEQAPPTINVESPAVNVTVPKTPVTVNVPEPKVDVHVPALEAPHIEVNVPETHVDVHVPAHVPDVMVNIPEPKKRKTRVVRDADGKITGSEEQ